MDPNAEQRQNLEETIRLLRDLAKRCPRLTDVLVKMADSNEKAIAKGRLHIEQPGQGILVAGDRAETRVERSWLNRFTATTLSASLFPGRTLDKNNCSDVSALVTLLATMTHETYHRRCDVDPDVYDLNIALLKEIKACITPEYPCAAEFSAALDAEIAAETAARRPGGDGSEKVKNALLSGGVGVLAGGLAIKLGLTAALVGGAKGGGVIGAAGGPGGIVAGIGIGFIAGGLAYLLYDACE